MAKVLFISMPKIPSIVALFILLVASFQTVNAMAKSGPQNLKVGEGFVSPLGYYEVQPRFSWQLSQDSSSLLQSAYHLQVSKGVSFKRSNFVWDSGKVQSASSAWITYKGVPLASRQKVYWRVKVWDEKDKASEWSETQSIELGLLHNTDWQAKWVGHPDTNERKIQTGPKGFEQADNLYYRPQYLRTIFNVNNKVKKARLYVTAKGVFKPYLNGQAISDDVMTPGWTPYHKRIETLTYDVTEHIQKGKNALGASLAEGWHSGRIFHPTKKYYVPPMRFLAQLEITYQNGETQVITSNETWKSTNQGPIRAAGNYDGEHYDANFEMPDWNKALYNDQNWVNVYAEPIDSQVLLQPKRHTAVRSKLTIPAIAIKSMNDGVVVFDMGQNMVGVPEIFVPAKKGQPIKLRFAEALEQGEFNVRNMRSAKNLDVYVPANDGKIRYRPTFTFHGYRYVELSGYDTNQEPSIDWVKGHVLHSNFAVHNNFKTSHSKLNKLSENVSWGLRGNFLDIPTDCPQRDERLGWTGDAQVFVSTSMYKADVYGFWAAWMQSVREDQGIDGMVPKFVPFRPFLTGGTAAAWGDAATIVPWDLYQFTGDTQILADNYTLMKRWLKYTEFHSFGYISNMGTYGDWLQPFAENGRAKGDTHPDLIATAYFARSVDIAAKTAAVLGYKSDQAQYEALFKKIQKTFRGTFFDTELNLVTEVTKTIKRDGIKRLKKPKQITTTLKATQTSYLLPLAFGLFNDAEQAQALKKLLAMLKQSDYHLGTGFLGTPLLYEVLHQHGYSDVMYDILLKETYPSWFYSINNGATTTWERWNSYSLEDGFNKANMNSLNHYAYGAVAKWFYTGVLGVQASEPGFKTFTVAPQFTNRLNNIDGFVPTIHGDIVVSWKVQNDQLSMVLEVPKNTQANLNLTNVKQLKVEQQGKRVDTREAPLMPGKYNINGVIEI